jgi:hypothetical protein
MKKLLFIPFCLILWSFSLSDNPFEKYLTRITDPEIIKRDLATITVWNSNFKKESDQKITAESQWEMLYRYESGWHEPNPKQRFIISELAVGNPGNSISGATILDYVKSCRQDTLLYSGDPLMVNLLSEARGAPYNGKWVVFSLRDDRICLRYVHSYPNGNQSSWYHRTEYYFQQKK